MRVSKTTVYIHCRKSKMINSVVPDRAHRLGEFEVSGHDPLNCAKDYPEVIAFNWNGNMLCFGCRMEEGVCVIVCCSGEVRIPITSGSITHPALKLRILESIRGGLLPDPVKGACPGEHGR